MKRISVSFLLHKKSINFLLELYIRIVILLDNSIFNLYKGLKLYSEEPFRYFIKLKKYSHLYNGNSSIIHHIYICIILKFLEGKV